MMMRRNLNFLVWIFIGNLNENKIFSFPQIKKDRITSEKLDGPFFLFFLVIFHANFHKKIYNTLEKWILNKDINTVYSYPSPGR